MDANHEEILNAKDDAIFDTNDEILDTNDEILDVRGEMIYRLIANLSVRSGIRLTMERDEYKIKIHHQDPVDFNHDNPMIMLTKSNQCVAVIIRSRTRIIVIDLDLKIPSSINP